MPPLVVSFLLFIIPQAVFLRMSFFKDLGLGQVGSKLELANYIQFFRDPFYLKSLGLTAYLSTIVVTLALLFGFPVGYVLARMRSRWASVLLAVIMAASFITVIIKVLGLIIIVGANGPVNRLLLALRIIDSPMQMLWNRTGVVIGLLHYTLPLIIVMLFSMVRTIPRSLEEAAQIHGASRWRVFWRVVIPLSLPGLLGSALMVFNMSMGAFTSAVLLGGGKVLTLPVLIQRTVILETRYGMGAVLSGILLVTVLFVNLLSIQSAVRVRGAMRPGA